jgi:hypothetical protein
MKKENSTERMIRVSLIDTEERLSRLQDALIMGHEKLGHKEIVSTKHEIKRLLARKQKLKRMMEDGS